MQPHLQNESLCLWRNVNVSVCSTGLGIGGVGAQGSADGLTWPYPSAGNATPPRNRWKRSITPTPTKTAFVVLLFIAPFSLFCRIDKLVFVTSCCRLFICVNTDWCCVFIKWTSAVGCLHWRQKKHWWPRPVSRRHCVLQIFSCLFHLPVNTDCLFPPQMGTVVFQKRQEQELDREFASYFKVWHSWGFLGVSFSSFLRHLLYKTAHCRFMYWWILINSSRS